MPDPKPFAWSLVVESQWPYMASREPVRCLAHGGRASIRQKGLPLSRSKISGAVTNQSVAKLVSFARSNRKPDFHSSGLLPLDPPRLFQFFPVSTVEYEAVIGESKLSGRGPSRFRVSSNATSPSKRSLSAFSKNLSKGMMESCRGRCARAIESIFGISTLLPYPQMKA